MKSFALGVNTFNPGGKGDTHTTRNNTQTDNAHSCNKIAHKNRAQTHSWRYFYIISTHSFLYYYTKHSPPTPFLLPDRLFYSWRLLNKVANGRRKISKQYTPACYCLLLPPIKYFFMVITESIVAYADSFLVLYLIKWNYLSIEQLY